MAGSQTSGDTLRERAVALVDAYYLDDAHVYGCAESVFMTLKDVYGLEAPTDPGPAIALNGGIAYSGGMCGAITGAALAVGMLAEQRIEDHRQAKLVARGIVQTAIDAFEQEYGMTSCRDLIDHDLRAPGEHEAFMASGLWREACASQIRTVVGHLAPLAEPVAWEAAVARAEATQAHDGA